MKTTVKKMDYDQVIAAPGQALDAEETEFFLAESGSGYFRLGHGRL